MKKSIGLTANISEFRPNLPQTKHLNYFMGTNPVYMAGGGDVKAGIPNYPDVNVTRGFLPAALGFDNGGEADGFLSKLKRLFEILDGDLVKFLSFLKDKLGYSDDEAQKIANQISGQDAQPPLGAVDVTPQPVAPKDTVTPKDTVDVQPPSGAVDVTGKPTRIPDAQPPYGAVDVTPDPTSPKMPDNIPVQSLPGPVGSGIIPLDTQYRPEIPDAQPPPGAVDVTGKPTEAIEELPWYLKPLDINGDGKITIEDANIATGAIKEAILKFLGLTDEKTIPEEKPDRVEVPGQGGPVDTVPSPVEPKITDKEEDKIIKDGGITGIPPAGAVDVTGTPTLTKEDQKTLKAGADIASGGIGDAKDKKDVPAWALPMMSAGFAMMASKSPYFLQALGEGGQKGLETFAAQKTAEEEKLDKESTRELQKAQTKYYMGEGRQPSAKTMVQNGIVGQIKNGVWEPIMDSTTNKPLRNTIGRAEAMEILSKNDMFNMASQADKEKMITEYMDIYNNTNTFINDKIAEKEGGFSLGDAVGVWITDWLGLKSGGIVSLRR